MKIFFQIIQFLIIAWSGYLLSAKTKMKFWEVTISQILVGSVTIFVGVFLVKNNLI